MPALSKLPNVLKVKRDFPIFVFDDIIVPNLETLIQDYRRNNPETHRSNVKASWRSDWKIHEQHHEFQPLIDKVIDKLEMVSEVYYGPRIGSDYVSFSDKSPIRNLVKYSCSNFWIMQYERGNYALKHSHFPSDFSCAYYVNVDPHCSPLVFESRLEVEPKEGRLILFDGNLQHEVPPTKSKRTVISMNFLKEVYGN